MKHLMFVVLSLAACSKSGGKHAGKVASCYAESMHACSEYRDNNLALGTESVEKLCTVVVSTAKFSLAPCPTAKIIASCTKNEGKEIYYTGYYETPAAIEARCKASEGKFATK